MSTHSICFHGKIKKKNQYSCLKKSALSEAMSTGFDQTTSGLLHYTVACLQRKFYRSIVVWYFKTSVYSCSLYIYMNFSHIHLFGNVNTYLEI